MPVARPKDESKTEGVVLFVGPDVKKTREPVQELALQSSSCKGGCPAVILSSLRIATTYKHLGFILHGARTSFREVAARAKSASAATGALSRRLLERKGIPRQRAGSSRALHAAGTWLTLGATARKRVHFALQAICWCAYSAEGVRRRESPS